MLFPPHMERFFAAGFKWYHNLKDNASKNSMRTSQSYSRRGLPLCRPMAVTVWWVHRKSMRNYSGGFWKTGFKFCARAEFESITFRVSRFQSPHESPQNAVKTPYNQKSDVISRVVASYPTPIPFKFLKLIPKLSNGSRWQVSCSTMYHSTPASLLASSIADQFRLPSPTSANS